MNTFFSILLAILLLATPALAQGPGNMTAEDLFIRDFMFRGTLMASAIVIGVLIFKMWGVFVEKRRQLYTELQFLLGKMSALFATVMAPRSHRLIRDSLRLKIWQLEGQAGSSTDPAISGQIEKVNASLQEHLKKPVFGGVTLADMVPPGPLEGIVDLLRPDTSIHWMFYRQCGLGGVKLLIHLDEATPRDVELSYRHWAEINEMSKKLGLEKFLIDHLKFPKLPMELPGEGPPKSFAQHCLKAIHAKALFVGFKVDNKSEDVKAEEHEGFFLKGETKGDSKLSKFVYSKESDWKEAQSRFLRSVPMLFLGRDSASNIDNRAMIRNIVAMGYLLAFFHLIAQEEQRTGGDVDLLTHVFPVQELNKLGSRYAGKLLDASSNEKTRDNVKILLDKYAIFAKMIDSLPWYHGQDSREMAATYTIQA
jgi:hypothetical protein